MRRQLFAEALAIALCGATPALAQVAPVSVDSAVSINQFFGQHAADEPDVVVDITATARFGKGWVGYARPWFRRASTDPSSLARDLSSRAAVSEEWTDCDAHDSRVHRLADWSRSPGHAARHQPEHHDAPQLRGADAVVRFGRALSTADCLLVSAWRSTDAVGDEMGRPGGSRRGAAKSQLRPGRGHPESAIAAHLSSAAAVCRREAAFASVSRARPGCTRPRANSLAHRQPIDISTWSHSRASTRSAIRG